MLTLRNPWVLCNTLWEMLCYSKASLVLYCIQNGIVLITAMTTLTELQNEVSILRTRCQYLQQEVRQKDGEIAELKKAHQNLKEMKRSASVHSFQPTMALDALPVEFEAVKKGLMDTVDKCKQLLMHLDLMTNAKTPVFLHFSSMSRRD